MNKREVNQLNSILIYLRIKKPLYASTEDICNHTHLKSEVVYIRLWKLFEDELIDANSQHFKEGIRESRINDKGLEFIKIDGYNKQRKEIISINLQSAQTWAISVGTALAGSYALIEIIQKILTFYKR